MDPPREAARGSVAAMIAGMTADSSSDLDRLLDEQITYYRAIAGEYEDHSIPFPGATEIFTALEGFRPTGTVLELACGQGMWTTHLLRHCDTVTAVDASPEMIAIASSRVDRDRVRFVNADLFDWAPRGGCVVHDHSPPAEQRSRPPHREGRAPTCRPRTATRRTRLGRDGHRNLGVALLGRGWTGLSRGP